LFAANDEAWRRFPGDRAWKTRHLEISRDLVVVVPVDNYVEKKVIEARSFSLRVRVLSGINGS
jgi:hypothetical protein